MTTPTPAAADPAVAPVQDGDSAAPTWRDGKRYLWLMGIVIPLLPLAAWGLVEATGVSAFWWFGPVFVFGVLPLIDILVGTDGNNPPDEAVAWLERDRYYRWVTYAFIPVQYASLVWAAYAWTHFGMGVVEKIGLALTVGIVGGIAINTAHELGHKKEEHERWAAKIALAQTGYGHFFIEHNRGHHVRVATPEDGASSRLGESFYTFWPRTVAGSFTSSWHLEKKRLARRKQSPWTLRNDVLNAWAMTAVLFVSLMAAFGASILPYLVLQAVVGFTLLEIVNYLEHHGLLRQKEASGRYERVRPRHSWNSNNLATNLFLYHLQRHSDHHANPTRRYQALRDFEEAPQLPTGYAGMMVLALMPPLWRRVIEPRVHAHYDGDLTLANLQPSKREAILARYPVPAATTSSTSAVAA